MGGKEQTQSLVVRKDPNAGGTEADIDSQTRMLVDLRRDLNDAADAVNRIEIVRGQIEALGRIVDDVDIKKAGADLNQKLIDLEMNLIDLRLTGGQDGIRYASKLMAKIGYLAGGLASADFKPTDQQVEVQRILADQLRTHLRLFRYGRFTLGAAHFGIMVPGTADHRVISWEFPEQLVTVLDVRPVAPLFPPGVSAA